jgi:hypothetical protein
MVDPSATGISATLWLLDLSCIAGADLARCAGGISR